MRTLRNWEKACGRAAKKLGRRGHSAADRRHVYFAAGRQLRQQGWTAGWRPISESLVEEPVKLVQWAVSLAKARKRVRQERRLKAARQSVEVLAADVIWAEDSTHVGRIGKRSVEADVMKDRGTLRTRGVFAHGTVDGVEVVEMLETTKRRHGRLPLVVATDNGVAYVSRYVSDYFERERVIHLRSKVHTPQDNGAAERGIGELKAESGLGKGVRLHGVEGVVERLSHAAHRLDHFRLRGSKGYRTAIQLEADLPRWYDRVNRERFYQTARSAMLEFVREGMSARDRRRAEREAVYRTLEAFGLVKRTRGGRSILPVVPENIS